MADKQNMMTPKHDRPFGPMQRFADEMDRLFDNFGLGRQWTSFPSWSGARGPWQLRVDVYQQGDRLTVKADLPGLKRDEVSVDITDDALTIHGEHKGSHEEDRDGYYRSERSYGSFYRVIPLPEGAMADQAKAEFRDGVLEITMPAPPASTKSRRLEISEGAAAKK